MDLQKLKVKLNEINDIGNSYRFIKRFCSYTNAVITVREEAQTIYELSLEILDMIREEEIDNLLKERNNGNVSDKG
jgi:hypothetical protein